MLHIICLIFLWSMILVVVNWFLLQEIIKDQVANMYLWPKTLEVPILDPAK